MTTTEGVTATAAAPVDPALANAAPGGVLVVDFGAQYSQLIARRIRECRVFSAIVPHDADPAELAALRPAGLVLSGGPASVWAEGAPVLDRRLLELGIPVLGICYGMQSIAQALGGEVAQTGAGEFGKTALRVEARDGMFGDLPADACWMSHRDAVVAPPPGFRVSARTDGSPVAAMEDPARRLFGVQFHPEVKHTPFGNDLLKWFLFDVCDCAPSWTATHVIEEQVERVRAQVGDGRAICALSGGVDSAVAALIVHRAIGDRLTCVFVDHGLLRLDEGRQVEQSFGHHFGVPLVHVRAQDIFIDALAGVTEPEEKRRIIGREFIRAFEREADQIDGARFLVQGTLYSDVIESGSRDRLQDQEPPQRGRAARGHGGRADRAVAPAVQGRGPHGWRGAGPARAHGLAAALPGARARHPHHRRRHAGAARHPPPRRPRPAGGDPAGGALSRPLAELRRPPGGQERRGAWATSARTPIRSSSGR